MNRVVGDFTADATRDKKIRLKDLRGQNVVIYFYPKDNTSGCTKEACAFRDDFPKFKRGKAEILGVSPDSVASHEKFARKYDLPFTLLADEDHKICQKYGVWQQKSMYGRKYMGVARTTFIIDKAGKAAEPETIKRRLELPSLQRRCSSGGAPSHAATSLA